MRLRLPLLPLLLPLFLLCASGPATALMAGSTPDTPQQRLDLDPASPFAGVGSIAVHERYFTGVLISPRHVLTAAHVAATGPAQDIRFHLGMRGEVGYTAEAREIHIYPGYTGFASGKPAEGDLAIITLSRPVVAYPFYPVSRRALQSGTRLLMASYGASGNGNLGVSVAATPNERRLGANVADLVRPARDGSGRQALYYFDFDGPDASSNRFGGSSLGNAIETSLADGDSGSPAFSMDRNGRLLLVGINSFRFGLDSTFGNGGGGQVLASYADWIDTVVSTPLAPPPEAGPPQSGQSVMPSTTTLLGGLLLLSTLPVLRRRQTIKS